MPLSAWFIWLDKSSTPVTGAEKSLNGEMTRSPAGTDDAVENGAIG